MFLPTNKRVILQEVKIKRGKENWIGIGQRGSGSAMQSQQNLSQPRGSSSAGKAHQSYLELGQGSQAILFSWMQVLLGKALGETVFSLTQSSKGSPQRGMTANGHLPVVLRSWWNKFLILKGE